VRAILLCNLCAFALAVSAAAGGTASQVSQYGVTWYFSQSREVGRYVNGDWWVVGTVTVTSVSPAPGGGRNGSMVNPSAWRPARQGYDSRSEAYDASSAVSYPVTLSAGSSLVSTISWTDTATHTDLIGYNVGSSVHSLRTAAVLTVVSSAPPADAFRPPLAGTVKPVFRTSDIDMDLLPRLPAPGSYYNMAVGRDAAKTICEQYGRYFQRPWLHHVNDWQGRQIHPTENMPNYHREVYNVVADAAGLLLLDHADIEQLLYPFLQVAIDMHYAGQSGSKAADSSLHKWPVIFAGILLNDAGLKNTSWAGYRTDRMTYYWADETSPFTSSIVPAGRTWTGATVYWRQDPGDQEHEHLHYSEWGVIPNGGGIKRETYRRSNSFTWPAAAAAAHVMNATGLWNHPAFFDYVDRWMTEPDAANRAALEAYWGANVIISGQSAGSGFAKWIYETCRHAQPMSVDAGDDQMIVLPAAAYLDGALTHPNPGSVTLTWSVILGSGAVLFSDPHEADTYVSFSAPDSYTLRLTADDGLTTVQDYVTVHVFPEGVDLPPTADAGDDRTVTDADGDGIETVALDGTGSTDPAGTIVSYVWTAGGSQIATGASTAAAFPVGTTTVTLTVTDDGGATGADTVEITVIDGATVTSGPSWRNFPMTPQSGAFTVEFDAVPNGSGIDGLTNLSSGQAAAYADTAVTVRFNVSGTIDARDGGVYGADNVIAYTPGTSYHFRIEVDVPNHTYSAYVTPAGGAERTVGSDYPFRNGQESVTQLDYWNVHCSIGTHTVSGFGIVGDEPVLPIADAGDDIEVTDTDGNGFELVLLDGADSYHPSLAITEYLWSEGESYLGSDASLPGVFAVGPHTVTLKVTASDGSQAADTVLVNVLPAPDKPGDADGDDDVDLDDFVILKTNFGRNDAARAEGDFDGDGDVDLDDFVILKNNFGS